MNDELVKALRYCSDNEKVEGCDECPYMHKGMCRSMLHDAAYALEVMQSDLAKKDSQLAEWKQAWKTAYKCYQSAQSEIDEMRGTEPDAEGDDRNEASEPNP